MLAFARFLHSRLEKSAVATLVPIAMLVGCAGTTASPAASSSIALPLGAPRAAEGPSSGWELEWGESIYAGNNSGLNSAGACSGGLRTYGCEGMPIQKVKQRMPALSEQAPSGGAPASASESGTPAMGALEAALTISATARIPYVSDSYAYGLQYWDDEIIPPASDLHHPPGTPVTYKVTLEDKSQPFTVDCYPANSTYEAMAYASGGDQLTRENGCTTQGAKKQSTKFTTSYGAGGTSIWEQLLIDVTAADNADHPSSSSSFPKIRLVVYVDGLNGATYTTASGVCYKTSGSCP